MVKLGLAASKTWNIRHKENQTFFSLHFSRKDCSEKCILILNAPKAWHIPQKGVKMGDFFDGQEGEGQTGGLGDGGHRHKKDLTLSYGGTIMYVQPKWGNDMDRTTIMLPPELKIRASNQAKKKNISLGQFIREALNKYLDSENKTPDQNDPFLGDNAVFRAETPHDLASNHDEYLYGD